MILRDGMPPSRVVFPFGVTLTETEGDVSWKTTKELTRDEALAEVVKRLATAGTGELQELLEVLTANPRDDLHFYRFKVVEPCHR